MHKILLFIGLLLFTLSSCNLEVDDPIVTNEPEAVGRYDFETGSSQGWEFGIADIPLDTTGLDTIGFEASVVAIPNSLSGGTGIRLAANDPRKDVFLYIKERFGPLRPSTSYTIFFSMSMIVENLIDTTLLDQSLDLFLKVGVSREEPIAVETMDSTQLGYPGYTLNLDKGNGNVDGEDFLSVGAIPIPEIPGAPSEVLEPPVFNIQATTDSDGFLWICIGTDSQSGIRHAVYYEGLLIDFFPS